MELKVIARIENDFPTKFGLPRQSGPADGIISRVVFEKEYAVPESLRGLDGYSHIWLIWGFSGFESESWSPTVRPPRLGGNRRMGVFATRSPNRPNPLGLSCTKLLSVEPGVLTVSGTDMMHGTEVYDIKPYLPYTDIRSDAVNGFAEPLLGDKLDVSISNELMCRIPPDKRGVLTSALRNDPRPGYHHDDQRIYGFEYAGFEIKFKVAGTQLVVTDIIPL